MERKGKHEEDEVEMESPIKEEDLLAGERAIQEGEDFLQHLKSDESPPNRE